MSSTTGLNETAHPVARFAARLHAVLDDLAAVPVWSMTPEEQRSVLVDLARGQARLEGVRLAVLSAADTADIAKDSAATSTWAWVAQHSRQTRLAAHADVQLATSLERLHPTVLGALRKGLVDVAQSRAIVCAVAALPASVTGHQRELAEKHLVTLAAHHDAAALKILGRRLFEVIDPDAADEDEGRRLEAEEAAAARTTFLNVFDNGDGTHSGRFRIPSLQAAMLTKMLHAFTSPARHATGLTNPRTGTPATATAPSAEAAAPPTTGAAREQAARQQVSRPEQLGEAFCQLLERVPAERVPATGGVSATVVVLLDYDRLLTGLGAAHLDTGQPLSAAQARHLACTAGVIPAVYQRVLGGPPVILDMGRKTRLHTEHQRIALAIRDGGCTADGCDRPPAWTEAHHDTPWSQGGDTSLDNGRLLCRFHHQRAHSPHYDDEHLPNGQLRFHRRN